MKNFTDIIGNKINLNIDEDREEVQEKKEEEYSAFKLKIKEKEDKTSVLVYMSKDFLKKYDKFIKKYNRPRSEMIVEMLQVAMEVIEKEDATK